MSEYRRCAGIIVFNRDKKVLICARKDQSSLRWQFPQGGINEGESVLEAALRELEEETSIRSVKPVYTQDGFFRYHFPDFVKKKLHSKGIESKGQDMHWSLLYFEGDDSEINLATSEPEFKAWRWADIDEALDKIVFFKKGVYAKAIKLLKPIMEEYAG